MTGDADIAVVAALAADPARARVLQALGDGRALAASTLADEAGIAASTASGHLAKLVAGGLLSVERHGRHRYYRLAGSEVGELLEALARLAPATPVRSLRQGTRAQAVRAARTCYDHLAGRLGTALMSVLIDQHVLVGGDGHFDAASAVADRLSNAGRDVEYRLSTHGVDVLQELGIDVARLQGRSRPLVRYCVDWSEQRHHLAGGLGAALADRLFELEWIRRADRSRAVLLTPAGLDGFAERFKLDLDGLVPAPKRARRGVGAT